MKMVDRVKRMFQKDDDYMNFEINLSGEDLWEALSSEGFDMEEIKQDVMDMRKNIFESNEN